MERALMPGRIKYNVIIFMRDTSSVVRLRISDLRLRLGVAILLLFVLMAVGSGGLGLYRSSQVASLRNENQLLKSGLRKAEREVNRLTNVANIMESYDQEELQSVAMTVPLTNGLIVPVDLNEIFSKEDLQVVSIDNVQAKFDGEDLRFNYDVNNLQTSDTVTGEADFSLITREGIVIDLPQKGNQFYFEINKFKPTKLKLTIPPDLDKNEIFAIRIRIKQKTGKTIFSEAYPLSHILS
ncbi:MAG: hypothetical protein ACLFQR_06260 [Desulfovibrionales bacterium]